MNAKQAKSEFVQIPNMTAAQCRILDTMWEIGSSEDMEAWMQTLDTESRVEAEVLKEMLLLAFIDLTDETVEADIVLDKFRL